MKIAVLQKTTLLDFPSHIACIVFLAGCNFRCGFCHSPELVLENQNSSFINEEGFFDFLEKRKSQLDGVVLCGGEPTLQTDLLNFCSQIKTLGYLIKLDTNGSRPAMLEKLISNRLLDYVALDIKTSKEKYPKAIGVSLKNIAEQVEKSAQVLKKNNVDYEFRTTCVPNIVTREDILQISQWVGTAKRYFLQTFRPQKTLDSGFGRLKPYSDQEMAEFQKIASPFFNFCSIR